MRDQLRLAGAHRDEEAMPSPVPENEAVNGERGVSISSISPVIALGNA
jgi:hypothetical protein